MMRKEGGIDRKGKGVDKNQIGKPEGKDHNRDRNFPDRNDEKRGGS
jgi:hypothetical protein